MKYTEKMEYWSELRTGESWNGMETRVGKRTDWGQEGAVFGGSSAAILFPFLVLIHLPGFTWTCIRKIADKGPSRLIGAAKCCLSETFAAWNSPKGCSMCHTLAAASMSGDLLVGRIGLQVGLGCFISFNYKSDCWVHRLLSFFIPLHRQHHLLDCIQLGLMCDISPDASPLSTYSLPSIITDIVSIFSNFILLHCKETASETTFQKERNSEADFKTTLYLPLRRNKNIWEIPKSSVSTCHAPN